jgi:hypothetical protein
VDARRGFGLDRGAYGLAVVGTQLKKPALISNKWGGFK